MTVSLFSLIVARGAEVPVDDPRLLAHVEYAAGVDTLLRATADLG